MLLSLAERRRVLLVGGKGGVGKTSIASALALARARAGARVLLVSTDPAHNLGHLWGREVTDEPTPLVQDSDRGDIALDGLEIDPDSTVERHLTAVRTTMLRMLPERMHGPAQRHLDRARHSPGTHESAVLDRLAESIEEGLDRYDLVVVDTAPTGHTLRLLAMPERLTSWTEGLLANRDRAERFGAALRGVGGADLSQDRDAELRRILRSRQRRYGALRDVVADASMTSFAVVLTAERLPVLESIELTNELRQLGVDIGALLVNRRSPSDAGALLAERRRLEDDQIRLLRRELPDVSVVEIPLLPGDPVGPAGVEQIAAALHPV